MVNGYFKQAHLDVMTGTDAVIAMGLADPDKLVKMGWSAGGHMTNKIITFTDRFKAASSGAGAANWISMYAQSDHREFRTPWFGGTPWQKNAPIDMYWNHSPLKDVANVKTPTIFLVGEQDPRVPMPQSVEMYRALKYNGVPDQALRRAARGSRLGRAAPPPVQVAGRDGVVREVGEQPRLHVGKGAGRREEGSPKPTTRPAVATVNRRSEAVRRPSIRLGVRTPCELPTRYVTNRQPDLDPAVS